MYKLSTAIVFCLIVFRISAQTQLINGTVADTETRQPVRSCSVTILNTLLGTTTDAAGKFELIIPQNLVSARMIVSSIGYKSDTLLITPRNYSYQVLLKAIQSALNEVVVTGVSKATLIRENPVSVISVPAKAIEQTTESNIIDVLVKNVPGLNAVKTGPNISKPFIRGLGYNRVLTLYDGVRQEGQQWGDEHGIEADAYNIDRAEVIKGPASIMYGSDAVAGVVGLMPAMAANNVTNVNGKYFSEYQSNNGLIGNGLRINYSCNHWSYTLRGSYRMAKNYSNNIDARVYNTGFMETNASSTLEYKGNKGTTNLNVTLYDNYQGIPDGSRDSLTRKFTKQIYEGNNDDIKNRPVVSDGELNAYHLSPLHQHIQHYRVYSNSHYSFVKGDADFLLAFQQNRRREYNHPSMPKQAGMFVRLNTINYAFRYNAPVIYNTDISIGINGMYQNNKNKSATDFPIPDYGLFDAGMFLFAKWKKNEWTISSGIRYDVRYLKGNDFYTKPDPATGFDSHAVPSDRAGAYLQFAAFNKTFYGSSVSIGATYQINEHFSVKANIARGYRAPTITEFASNGLDPGAHIKYLGNRDFIPEFSLQEDMGIDIHDKEFAASVSFFNNNIQNYIYLNQLTDANQNAVTDLQGNKTYQYQQAAARLYGLEATLNIHSAFIEGLSFENSFSAIYGYNKKSEFKSKGLQGEYLPLIPPMKLYSSISKEVKTKSTIFSTINVRTEADFNAAQNRFLLLDNTETATPANLLINFSINFHINYTKRSALQLQLQVNNIFDKAFQSNLSRLKYFEYYNNSPKGYLGIYNMGRNICMKAIVPF